MMYDGKTTTTTTTAKKMRKKISKTGVSLSLYSILPGFFGLTPCHHHYHYHHHRL